MSNMFSGFIVLDEQLFVCLFVYLFVCFLAFLVSYESKDLMYEWKSELESDIFIYDNEMAQFDIISAKRFGKHDIYHSGMSGRLCMINNSGF